MTRRVVVVVLVESVIKINFGKTENWNLKVFDFFKPSNTNTDKINIILKASTDICTKFSGGLSCQF